MHSSQLPLSPPVPQPARVSLASLVLADRAAAGDNALQCGFVPHLLCHLQRHLPALQPSHQPLLDHGEAAQGPHLLFTVPHHPRHRALTKV